MSRTGQLLLAGVLVLWHPLGFAATAGRSLQSLGFRGVGAAIELAIAGLVAAVSLAAASALWSRAPHGASLARLALVLAAARSVQSLYWTYLPSDVVPGTERLLAVIIVTHAALWLVYVSRSSRTDAVT